MFLLNSLQSGSLRRHFSRSVFALCVLVCLSAALFLTGCPIDDEDSVSLNGLWVLSSNPTYVINTSANTIQHFAMGGGGYSGTIVNNPDFTATSGVLIIRFTQYLEPEWNADWTAVVDIIFNPPNTVGRYGALYWRNLSYNSVITADYWDFSAGAVHVMFPTQAEAVAFFTTERGNEIDWSRIAPNTR